MKEISNDSLLGEEKIQKTIFEYVNAGESFVFNSGAGSGKTYALIETLKHVLKNFGDTLKVGGQNVLCVTYTNAAVEEIKERLGDSKIIKVSTIHECLWGVIKNQQSALLKVHIKEVESKLCEFQFKLLSDTEEKQVKKYNAYRELSDQKKNEFKEYMLSVKDVFYRVRFKNSDYIRNKFSAGVNNASILKNVQNFKDIVSLIYKIENLKSCLESIANKSDGFLTVKYDANYNDDVLHKMIISHDTLLRYSFVLFDNYPILRRIVIDKNPYIFIDEYQDTSPLVVNIIKIISEYANKINHKIVIGYYGDLMQNIYGTGVGAELFSIHHGINTVNKIYNRRSRKEIIDVINNFRDDDLKQESIFEDCNGGICKFFENKDPSQGVNSIEKFVKFHKSEWNISNDNKLHCFVLLNKTIADLNGFSTLYNEFSNFIKFDQLNNDLLSKDIYKLGAVPRVFFKIMHFREVINKKNVSVGEILDFFGLSINHDFKINEIKRFIVEIKSLDKDNFCKYIKSIFDILSRPDVTLFFSQIIRSIFKFDDMTLEGFEIFLFEKLVGDVEDDDIEEWKGKIKLLLNVNFDEYLNWYKFICGYENTDVIYHTYHGVKGLQFKNTIVIMQNDFGGNNKGKFSDFFKSIGDDRENTRNLLYVACSRAIDNLSILYLDDISDFRASIESYFGKALEFS